MLEVAVQRVDVLFAVGEPLTKLAYLMSTFRELLLALHDFKLEALNGRRRFTVLLAAFHHGTFGALERFFGRRDALLSRGARGANFVERGFARGDALLGGRASGAGVLDLDAGICRCQIRRLPIVIGAAA